MRSRFWAEWILLRVSLAVLGRIGVRHRARLADSLGALAFTLLRIRRKTTLTNLSVAFGSTMSVDQRERIGRESYANLALSAMELASLSQATKTQAAAACVTDSDAILRESLSLKKGVILVTGHFGNWELLSASLAARGFPVSAVAARMKNRRVDAWLSNLRERFGTALIPTGRSSGRRALKALRSGRIVILLIDQDAKDRGVFVRFLGRMASTPAGAATLSQRSGAPIVPCRILRGTALDNTIVFDEALCPPERSEGESAVHQTMQELTLILENWIREQPSHWFWPHRRFKTAAPGESSLRAAYDT